MKKGVLPYASLALVLTLILIHPTEVKAEAPAIYPKVSISGSGTLTSNFTIRRVEVEFIFNGEFSGEQNVTIPRLNVTGTGMTYNISGSIKVEAEWQEANGIFSNVTFIYKGQSYHCFLISVANKTTEQLVFNALAPKMLLYPLPPGPGYYARYMGFLAATLWDSDYPEDFFVTKPPNFMSVELKFPIN